MGPIPSYEFALEIGAVPIHITSGERWWTLITSGFLHLTQFHLLSNLVILTIFGAIFERNAGSFHAVILMLCGIVGGALAHAFSYPNSDIPLYGISGGAIALAGALIATFLLWKIPPKQKMIFILAIVCIAGLLVFYNLRLALVGGALMPDNLIESGVAHGVGFGIGLIYGTIIYKFPNLEPLPSK